MTLSVPDVSPRCLGALHQAFQRGPSWEARRHVPRFRLRFQGHWNKHRSIDVLIAMKGVLEVQKGDAGKGNRCSKRAW